jgi:hypothetical protein
VVNRCINRVPLWLLPVKRFLDSSGALELKKPLNLSIVRF